jgi:hypothetical protein
MMPQPFGCWSGAGRFLLKLLLGIAVPVVVKVSLNHRPNASAAPQNPIAISSRKHGSGKLATAFQYDTTTPSIVSDRHLFHFQFVEFSSRVDASSDICSVVLFVLCAADLANMVQQPNSQ